jgi:hypothetical protein
MERSATFDPTGRYRYSLGRRWSAGPTLAIIMLNPSQADGSVDDPTIRRCIGLAQGWGFGAIAVVNLFAYRSPHPKALRQTKDPIGPGNDAALSTAAQQPSKFCWPGETGGVGWGAIAPSSPCSCPTRPAAVT